MSDNGPDIPDDIIQTLRSHDWQIVVDNGSLERAGLQMTVAIIQAPDVQVWINLELFEEPGWETEIEELLDQERLKPLA